MVQKQTRMPIKTGDGGRRRRKQYMSQEELGADSEAEDDRISESPADSDTEQKMEEDDDENKDKNGITKWTDQPGILAIKTRPEKIITHLAGVNQPFGNVKEPVECCKPFITDVMFSDIVKFTNKKLTASIKKYYERGTRRSFRA
ncbi:hypothetical protein ILUMI_06105 [Ignelater luminosus]|uniref:Uncharacterized protein n=1 Tax=Ignelater luminosus TaxID=2038154 RepID=A0A8K0D5X0_IGNLU|nr:hypothetical protein ILUMI_06105 [Ignelater luminosus]